MACGGFVLTNFQPEFLDYFEQGKHLVWYESHFDMMNKISYYLEHDDEREHIAQAGYQLVKDKHTMKLRVSELLEFFGG